MAPLEEQLLPATKKAAQAPTTLQTRKWDTWYEGEAAAVPSPWYEKKANPPSPVPAAGAPVAKYPMNPKRVRAALGMTDDEYPEIPHASEASTTDEAQQHPAGEDEQQQQHRQNNEVNGEPEMKVGLGVAGPELEEVLGA